MKTSKTFTGLFAIIVITALVFTACDDSITTVNENKNIPVITTDAGALADGTVNTIYSVTLTATENPASWTVSGGTLPTGLSLNNSGVISGTPEIADTFNFKITAANSDGVSLAVAFSITIKSAPNIGRLTPEIINSAIALTANTWTNGSIAKIDGEQWFKFTATTSSYHYIHAEFGTLLGFAVTLFDSAGERIGTDYYTELDAYGVSYISRQVTAEQTYYLRVFGSGDESNNTYKIAFNTNVFPPNITNTAVTLTVDTWAYGSISANAQWFKFTATNTGSQYIHIDYLTLDALNIQLYDSAGAAVGDSKLFYNTFSDTIRYISRSVTEDQTYFVRVWPQNASGTYRIAFNTSAFSPEISTATELTANAWTSGSISSGGEQWFVFTATTTGNQYIHAKLSGIYISEIDVQLYNSAGAIIGGTRRNLNANSSNPYWPVTKGEVYYVRVFSASDLHGFYAIAFNTTALSPDIMNSLITLTADTWHDFHRTVTTEQWFTFTAIASGIHNIHVEPGSSMRIYLYNSEGIPTENYAALNTINTYGSWSVAANQVYYARVLPTSGYSRIGFNMSTFSPRIMNSAYTLTADTWVGSMAGNAIQQSWFKFTATITGNQYIHIEFGTLTNMYIKVYDRAGNALGSEKSFSGSTVNASWEVTEGREYYIQVWSDSYISGNYNIAFNGNAARPGFSTAVELTADTWTDGDFSENGEQWYVFTATTTGRQYIHIEFDTLASLAVQLYNSGGVPVGGNTVIYLYNDSYQWSVTEGQMYYIRVRPYYSSGTYKISINASSFSPRYLNSAVELTADTWADGIITNEATSQLFKFTATTTGSQYIHVDFDWSLTVRVYNPNGTEVGNSANLQGNGTIKTYDSWTVTEGQMYYVQITSPARGTYKIGFTTNILPPNLMNNAVTLTSGAWTDGNIIDHRIELFKFTATTTGSQYIHIEFGVATRLYVQLYDSSGALRGSSEQLSGSTGTARSMNRLVTEGEMYYVGISAGTPMDRGAYKVAFSTSTLSPNYIRSAIELNADTWVDGSITFESSSQLFKFIATTTGNQFIHFQKISLHTAASVSIQLYNSAGETARNPLNTTSTNYAFSMQVIEGQMYYVSISTNNPGTYRIAFSTSSTRPE